jgi:hypothetical protein
LLVVAFVSGGRERLLQPVNLVARQRGGRSMIRGNLPRSANTSFMRLCMSRKGGA